jgi:hypothetical protein
MVPAKIGGHGGIEGPLGFRARLDHRRKLYLDAVLAEHAYPSNSSGI